MPKIREVRKRDNRIVPFDESKISDAIYAAIRSVGEGDRALSVELAAAVTHFLEEKYAGSIPGIEEIQDLVETVLIQMGHARFAKAYILYRQKRAMMRETLQVRKTVGHSGEGISFDYGEAESAGEKGGEPPLPDVDQVGQGVTRWQKSKIAAALIREADLDPGVAEEIAATVERKVIDSGMRRISSSLIRELVDNELFERGFSAKLQKQAPLGLPKYNLEQLIFGTDTKEGFTFPKTPSEVRNFIANRILHQYSLQEVFTQAVADAHREGRVFIHRLSDPIRLARLRWRLPRPAAHRRNSGAGLLSADAPEAYLDSRELFRRLAHFAHFFSEEIRLSSLSNLLLDTASRTASVEEKARSILERLSQMDERPELALELDLAAEAVPWLEGLATLAQVRQRRFLVALRVRRGGLGGPDGERALRAAAELYERGERVEFLPGWLEEPELPERAGLTASIAKVTINLPRAAFRSSRDKGASLERELDEVIGLAVKGLLERRAFAARLAANRESPLWGILGKGEGERLVSLADATCSVGVLGLNECVKFLSGQELHAGEEQRKLGLEIIRTIDRKLEREGRGLGIRLVLEETANVGPLRTLERIDREKCPQFAEIERGRQSQWGPAYTDGTRLHRMASVDPLGRVEDLASFLRHVEPSGGFVEDSVELRNSARDLLSSLLEECAPLVA